MTSGRAVVGVLVVVVVMGAFLIRRYAFRAFLSAWRDMLKRRGKSRGSDWEEGQLDAPDYSVPSVLFWTARLACRP
jgi:hypothetical protein